MAKGPFMKMLVSIFIQDEILLSVLKHEKSIYCVPWGQGKKYKMVLNTTQKLRQNLATSLTLSDP